MKRDVEKAHSSEQFGKQRNFWWNPDFVALLAERVGLRDCKYIADIGTGLGHWISTLIPECDPYAEITCVDREQLWVDRVCAEVRARSKEDAAFKITAVRSDAELLELPDSTFDLVTCQTLLMHVQNPRQVIEEMVRIAKPGGKILVVEPNNLMNYMQLDSTSWETSVEDHAVMYEFWMYCNRGRLTLGRGNDAIGQLLPQVMDVPGLETFDICLADKAYMMAPPYQSSYEKAWVEQSKDGVELSANYTELAEFARVAGAPAALIKQAVALAKAKNERVRAAVNEGTYYSSGGSQMYVAWARTLTLCLAALETSPTGTKCADRSSSAHLNFPLLQTT